MKTSNSDRYKKSFDNLHLSGDFSSRLKGSLEKEREDKKVVNFFSAGKIAAAIAICTLTCGTAVFAADVGGIRTNFNMWINGENREIEIEDNGDGSFTYYDEDGHEYGFGGVALGPFGQEEALGAEELVNMMNNEANLEFTEDDRVIFHYRNISEDVTDLIVDGNLYVHLEDPTNPYTYFNFTEIIPNGSYSCSTDDKAEKNTEYVEFDSSDLEEGNQAPDRDENTTSSYTVISD